MASTTYTLSPVNSRPGLFAELRALVAVFRREFIIMRRYPSWVIQMVIWPIIFPAGYVLSGRALAGPDGGGLQLFQQRAGTHDFIGFIAVGTMIWMWQNVVLWDVGFSLRNEQLRGTLETNWMTPAWRFSFLLGSSLNQMLMMSVFLSVAAMEYVTLFGVRLNGDPFLVLLSFLAAIPSIYGIGMAFSSLVIAAKEAHTFVQMVRGLVMIFCGITYPIAVMPGWMQGVAAWLPQTYIIHSMRSAILGGADFQALWPDFRMLLIFGAFWLVVGYLTFNWMERRARRNGTLGQY